MVVRTKLMSSEKYFYVIQVAWSALLDARILFWLLHVLLLGKLFHPRSLKSSAPYRWICKQSVTWDEHRFFRSYFACAHCAITWHEHCFFPTELLVRNAHNLCLHIHLFEGERRASSNHWRHWFNLAVSAEVWHLKNGAISLFQGTGCSLKIKYI